MHFLKGTENMSAQRLDTNKLSYLFIYLLPLEFAKRQVLNYGR